MWQDCTRGNALSALSGKLRSRRSLNVVESAPSGFLSVTDYGVEKSILFEPHSSPFFPLLKELSQCVHIGSIRGHGKIIYSALAKTAQ